MSAISRRARALRRGSALAVAGGTALTLAPSAVALDAPAPVVTAPATNPSPSATWTIGWAAVPADPPGGIVTYQFCVGLAAAPCTPSTATATRSVSVGAPTDGDYLFRVRAIQTPLLVGVPIVGPIGSVAFTRDSTVAPPTLSGGPAAGSRVNAVPPFQITGEAGATITWSFARSGGGGSQAGTGATAAFAAGNADGTWTFSAVQVDVAGNASTPATRSFVVDRVAPTGVAFSPAVPAVTNAPTPIQIVGGGTAADPVTYRFRVGGGALQTGATINLPALADGSHALQAFAVDVAGNQSAPIAATVLIDRAAPAAPTFTGPVPEAGFTASVPSFTIASAGEPPTTTLLWSLTGPVTRAETAGAQVNLGTLTADGAYTVRARARDAAGNVSPTSLRTFTLDRARPAAPTLTPDIGSVVSAPPVVAIAGGGEPSLTYRWQLDTATVQTGARADLAGLTVGAHTFSAWAVDRAGNESAKTTRAFRFDPEAPPAPTISNVPESARTAPDLTITGPARSTVVWTLEGPRNTGGEGLSPLRPTLGNLPDGNYALQAFVRNANGSRSAVSRVGFRVDNVAPAAPVVTSGPASARGGPRPLFTWRGETGGSFTWQVQRNDLIVQGPIKTSAFGERVALLGPGRYSFRISQTDAAGNSGPLSQAWEFQIRQRRGVGVVIAGLLQRKRVLVKPVGPLHPKPGRVVSFRQEAKITWVYRAGRKAQAFNVQIFDERGKKVLSEFPTKSTFLIPRKLLKPGQRLYWQVWPYWGPALGFPRRPLGVSYLDVRPSDAQIRAARALRGASR